MWCRLGHEWVSLAHWVRRQNPHHRKCAPLVVESYQLPTAHATARRWKKQEGALVRRLVRGRNADCCGFYYYTPISSPYRYTLRFVNPYPKPNLKFLTIRNLSPYCSPQRKPEHVQSGCVVRIQ